ncbi:hypothetical protein EW026_g623 [Hermanssonia centrifuga]|uniref:Chitobiosyldiphosphodolichol beta-mannosyltransferase n=1 Tax=Hermanssonia centrifuga TaxID=98765 RepID=A0A4S4KU16_9APHY|nr:hypothetical protein EW026_g623 [Hermanssonia centrifuga]
MFTVREIRGLKLVLHDRPPAHFHRASPQEMHELFLRLTPSFQKTPDLLTFLPSSTSPTSTPFTRVLYSPSFSSFSTDIGIETDTPVPSQRPDRPALLLSSTSWTPDEDFSILLKALSLYEQKAIEAEGRLPKVLMVVTGKGPEREKYMNEVGTLQSGGGGTEEGWKYVRCVSMWLEAADYPLLLEFTHELPFLTHSRLPLRLPPA